MLKVIYLIKDIYLDFLTLSSAEFSFWISKHIIIPNDIEPKISSFSLTNFELLSHGLSFANNYFLTWNKFPQKIDGLNYAQKVCDLFLLLPVNQTCYFTNLSYNHSWALSSAYLQAKYLLLTSILTLLYWCFYMNQLKYLSLRTLIFVMLGGKDLGLWFWF